MPWLLLLELFLILCYLLRSILRADVSLGRIYDINIPKFQGPLRFGVWHRVLIDFLIAVVKLFEILQNTIHLCCNGRLRYLLEENK